MESHRAEQNALRGAGLGRALLKGLGQPHAQVSSQSQRGAVCLLPPAEILTMGTDGYWVSYLSVSYLHFAGGWGGRYRRNQRPCGQALSVCGRGPLEVFITNCFSVLSCTAHHPQEPAGATALTDAPCRGEPRRGAPGCRLDAPAGLTWLAPRSATQRLWRSGPAALSGTRISPLQNADGNKPALQAAGKIRSVVGVDYCYH